jgi:hypothetical protein
MHCHPQNTTKYLGRRIAGIVASDPDVTVKVLVQTIFGYTGYRVNYSKVWRAKQHVLELVFGDWKEAYNLIPRILNAITHYNPGTKWTNVGDEARVLVLPSVC